MSREDHITRTTLYLESHLHSKAKEAGVNLSKEVSRYLETILFGDDVGDVQYQLSHVDERIKDLNTELTSLKARREQLIGMIDEHDAKLVVEQNVFNKFINHVTNILSNKDTGYSIDVSRLKSHWKRDYFSNNGRLSDKIVKNVIHKVDVKKFTFDDFQLLRRGADFGD